MAKGISVADLERAMGRKADHVSDYMFDPETGAFTRRITFKLDKPTRRKRPSFKAGEMR